VIPARELLAVLNPLGFERGTFVVLGGYIDDSGKGDLFTLSCLIHLGADISWLEFEWLKCLEKKNAELIAANRKPITRFHAADCNGRHGDFEGWDRDTEQIPFVADLLSILVKYRMDAVAFTVNLKELEQRIPASRHNPLRFAYVILLQQIMLTVANTTLTENHEAFLTLIHDRGNFDAVYLDSFNAIVKCDAFTFPRKDQFTTIAPMCWEKCTLLQPADFMAYENFRESDNQFFGIKRRKSLETLINKGKIGGSLHALTRDSLDRYAKWLDAAPPPARKLILDSARVPARYR